MLTTLSLCRFKAWHTYNGFQGQKDAHIDSAARRVDIEIFPASTYTRKEGSRRRHRAVTHVRTSGKGLLWHIENALAYSWSQSSRWREFCPYVPFSFGSDLSWETSRRCRRRRRRRRRLGNEGRNRPRSLASPPPPPPTTTGGEESSGERAALQGWREKL